MRKNHCDITVVMDRSGSMGHLQDEVIGAYNSFLKEQSTVKGTADITLVQFDDRYQVDYEAIDILDAEPLNRKTYRPRGMTSLYDAIGKTICSTNERIFKLKRKKRPEKVIFLVQTDGMENNSKEYRLETIKSMITDHKIKCKWEFVFMGSDPTTFADAKSFGIPTANVAMHKKTKHAYTHAFADFSSNTAQFRSGAKTDMSYDHNTGKTDEENASGNKDKA
jgi:hypothetical protein